MYKYYENLERERLKANREKKPDFYSTLIGIPKLFIDKTNQELEDNWIGHYFDNRKDFVGFRKAKVKPLLVYLSRHVNGDLFIHLYSLKNEKNVSKLGHSFDLYANVAAKSLLHCSTILSMSSFSKPGFSYVNLYGNKRRRFFFVSSFSR